MAYGDGRKSKVEIKGHADGSSAGSLIPLCVKKWECEIQKKEHNTNSTCNSDWEVSQVGRKVIAWSCEAELDLANSPLGAAIAVQNTDYAALKFYYDGSLTAAFDLPNATVLSCKITGDNEDIITFSLSGKSSGTPNAFGA